jgi:hypothetical protein
VSSAINIIGQLPFSTAPTAAINATFAANYHIFNQIGRRQQLAVMVQAIAARNATIHFNVDYTGAHKLLFSDGKLFTRGISNMDPITAQSAVYAALGTSAYALPNDLQAQLSTMSDLENLSEDELWRMVVMLNAAYGD